LKELRKQGEKLQEQFNNPKWKHSLKNFQWDFKDSVNDVKSYPSEKKAKKKLNKQD